MILFIQPGLWTNKEITVFSVDLKEKLLKIKKIDCWETVEAGSWKPEGGSWELEGGSRKPEGGSRKEEAGSWKVE